MAELIHHQDLKDGTVVLDGGTNRITVTSEAPNFELAESEHSNEAQYIEGNIEFEPATDGNYYVVKSIGGFTATELIIPDYHPEYPDIPVKKIANSAFRGLTQLAGVTISAGITEIGEFAFADCPNLTKIEFEESDTAELIICQSAFMNIPIASLHISNSVRRISASAFRHCENLKNLTFSDNCKIDEIGQLAFNDCASLTTVSLPEGLRLIGESAFSSCTGLVTVNIPDSLEEMGRNAFRSCTMLYAVNFGENSKLDKIGVGAFTQCSRLPTLHIPASVTQIGARAFAETFIRSAVFEDIYTWFYTESAVAENLRVIMPSDIDRTTLSGAQTAGLYLKDGDYYRDMYWFKLKRMLPPTISLESSILNITDPLGVAEEFHIYITKPNGVRERRATVYPSASGSAASEEPAAASLDEGEAVTVEETETTGEEI